jgi:acyl carrier protein
MAVSAERVLSIIASEAGLDEARIDPDATLAELDIGSIDVASVLFALEDEFGIVVEPDSIAPTSTVSEFVDRVMSLAAK